MAEITFHASPGYAAEISGATLTGLGFYGASFGASVQVGQYQDTTFITNGAGTIEGAQVTNAKYPGNSSGVEIDGDPEVLLTALPVSSGTLNVRFTNDSAVKTQNGELRIFDRTLPAVNGASGVTSQVAQLVLGGSGVSSSGTLQESHNGWLELAGSGIVMTLLSSPASGGLTPSGVDSEDIRHDWYVALSATPTSIGSKDDFGLFIELEFL